MYSPTQQRAFLLMVIQMLRFLPSWESSFFCFQLMENSLNGTSTHIPLVRTSLMATSGYKGYREIMVGQSLPSNEFTPKRGSINVGGLASSLWHTILVWVRTMVLTYLFPAKLPHSSPASRVFKAVLEFGWTLYCSISPIRPKPSLWKCWQWVTGTVVEGSAASCAPGSPSTACGSPSLFCNLTLDNYKAGEGYAYFFPCWHG